MRCRILAIGKPALTWAADGVADYSKRLRRYGGVETEWISAKNREKAGALQWKRSEGWYRILLDERGNLATTMQWVDWWKSWQLEGKNGVVFCLGGADGHHPPLRQQADKVISLAPMTLQHELALVVLLEQIYRVQSVLANAPYHREG